MKKCKFLLTLVMFFIIFIGGCATTEKYEENLRSWVGRDISNLIASWGYPSNSFKLPNGNTVYQYNYQRSYTTPITYNTVSNYNTNNYAINNPSYGTYTTGSTKTYQTGGQTFNYWCKTFFEVNKSNIIVKWRWEGNSCRSK